MYWTTTTEQGSWVAGMRGLQVPGKGDLWDQSSLGSAPTTERLSAHRRATPASKASASNFGRAGIQPRHESGARSALPLGLSYREGCAISVAASIRVSATQTTRPGPP